LPQVSVKATTSEEEKKGKHRDRMVYLTSVSAVLVEPVDFGLKKATIFFECGLASFTNAFHFSFLILPVSPALAQSTC
jgi:hypothetical protein